VGPNNSYFPNSRFVRQLFGGYPPRVFFVDFSPNAFGIQFIYWYAPRDMWKYSAFNEKLNSEIFRAFDAEEIQFSLPFRHAFWKHDAEKGPL